MGSKTHDLDDFMDTATKEMEQEYLRIQKRVKDDPGTAGDQGEENWAELLRGWLPSTYPIVTKGRILSREGIAGPQIDVLVLQPSYPRKLLGKKLYLAGGVVAAFECKITLKASHIKEAVADAVMIRKHLSRRVGSPYQELHSPLIFGLLAHSYAWKRQKSTPIENISDHLQKADEDCVTHPREMLDVLCVSDLATWISQRISWIGPKMVSEWSQVAGLYGPDGAASTSYVCFSTQLQSQKATFTPIGAMLSYLLRRLAWEEQGIRRFAQYFYSVQMAGVGGKGRLRLWNDSIYSNEIRRKVISANEFTRESWDEWCLNFW
jgi:hypothetical protein